MRVSETIELFFPFVGALLIGVCIGIQVSAAVAEASTKSSKPETTHQLVAVENPNQYFFGHVLSGDVFKYEKKVLTAIRVSPMHTSDIYNEQITFCDNQSHRFDKLTSNDTVVITYSKVANSSLCYDLVSVDVVK